MPGRVSAFEIRNLLREPLGVAEAVALIDGRDQLARVGREVAHADSWVGRPPNEVLGPDSPFLPRAEPHDAFVAVCSCGFLGCGGLLARISDGGDVVVWDDFRDSSESSSKNDRPVTGERFCFEVEEYREAVLARRDPVADWEPTTRMAAQLINKRLFGIDMGEHRLKFGGCGHVDDSRIQLKAFLGVVGDQDRALLVAVLPLTDAESADDLADRIVDFVRSGAICHDTRTVRRDISGHSR